MNRFQHPFRNLVIALAAVACLGGTAYAETPDVSNPENPWDEIGQMHNASLDYAVEARQDVGDSRAALTAAMLDRSADFAGSVMGSPCPLAAAQLETIAFITAYPKKANQRIVGLLNEEQAAYFLQIDELASHLASDPVNALESLRALEAEIAATLPEANAVPLLAGAAVARYSYAYWTSQMSAAKNSPWFAGTDLEGGDADFLIPKWLKADLKGAVSGAAGGAAGGLAGAGLGALIGGAAASLIDVIDDL